MAEQFDPYLHWLGIRDPQRPPNYYRLLGIELFESDPEVISNAADRQMAHVRTFQTGKHSALSQKILNELAAAKICLLNAEKKAQYDAQLLAQQAAQQYMPPLTTVAGPGQPPPGGLWPLNPPSFPPTPPESAPTEPEHAEAVPVSSWFSLLATVLVATILVLVGLIVAVMVKRSGEQAGGPSPVPSEEESTLAPPSIGPEQPPESPPKQKPTSPEEKPKEKPKPPEPPPLPPAGKSLRAVRQALAQRDTTLARKHLDFAQRMAPMGSPEAAEASRLNIVCMALEEFWKAAADALAGLQAGEKLLLGPSKQEVLVTAISGDKQKLEISLDGQKQWVTLKDMPIELALALARRKLPDNPSSLLAQIAALLWDPQADLAEAERLLQEAISKNVFQAEEFVEELKLAQATRPKGPTPPEMIPGSKPPPEKPPAPTPPEQPPKPEPKPEQPPPKPSRHPVPDSETQQKILAEIRQIFDREYKAAQKPEEKAKLADTLYRQGTETRDNPPAQYMLFMEARNLALESGHKDVLDRSLRRIAQNFDVDLTELSAAFFEEAAKRGRLAPANKAAAQVALELAQEAFAKDKLAEAVRLAQAAGEMARKASDSLTVKKATAIRRRFEDFLPRYEAFRKAEQTLQTNPDAPEANLAYGSYLCFAKQEWAAGLRHLAKGNHPGLKTLAELELASPKEPPKMVELGDKWWEAADSVASETLKDAYRARAGYWYRRVQSHVSGLTKTRVDRRLQELAQ